MSILTKTDKNGNNILLKTLVDAANGDQVAKEKFRIGMQAFMHEPRAQKIKIQALTDKIKIQGFSVSTDFPFLTGESFTHVHAENNYDLGFEEAFQDIPKVQGKRIWSSITTQDGLTFIKVPEGGRIAVVGLSGDKVFFQCDKFGGAIGWTYEAIEGREIMQMVNLANIFRNRYYENRANIGYTLLQAAAITNAVTPYATAGTGQLQNDILTINNAIYTLTFRLRNKGYGDMANMPVIIYANRILENRIGAALRATTANLAAVGASGQQITSRPMKVIYTYNTALAANRPIVLVPKWGFQKMDYMMPTTFTDKQDILTLNIAQSVWGDYGFGVADSEQAQNFIL
jgi:hypothetical protein